MREKRLPGKPIGKPTFASVANVLMAAMAQMLQCGLLKANFIPERPTTIAGIDPLSRLSGGEKTGWPTAFKMHYL
jgi:hypothetical protein